jgi:hypothetical protein
MNHEKFKVALPDEIKQWLIDYLKINPQGLDILGYGTGGSTFLFSDNPSNFVFACETSAQWLDHVTAEMKSLGRYNFLPLHMNIGSTISWGQPTSFARQCHLFEKAVTFPSAKCIELGFSPDFILVDGRFRVACFIEALRVGKDDSLILVDDYFDRKEYHVIEELCGVKRKIGRAALFCKADQLGNLHRLAEEKFVAYYFNPD